MPSHPEVSSTVSPQSLYFRKQGQGEPVILVHGLFGSLENLGALARILAQHFCVYSVDLPNHGRSPQSNTMSLSSMAADLSAWMSEQEIPSAMLVGHSLGAKVIMELALNTPDQCQKLVAIDIAPVHYEPHHTQVFKGLQALDPASLSSRSQADAELKAYVPELAVRSFLLKNLVKKPEGFSWRLNLSAISSCYRALIAANQSPAEPYRGEVLFIKGGNSDYILESHTAAIGARFPKAKLRLIANTGHWLHAEKPEHVAKLITRFLIG